MVANTGTYLDTPFHRYADGADLAELPLELVSALPGLVVRHEGPAIGPDAFAGRDVKGKAVLVHTGWDRHWRQEAYFTGHPFLTGEAAAWLREAGAALVGIDRTISTIPAAAASAPCTPSCCARASRLWSISPIWAPCPTKALSSTPPRRA
jgi:kynurenine formamidase